MTVASRMIAPRTGVLAIDMDHEQLQGMLESAMRAARLGDAAAAAEGLERAVRLAEVHSQEEEDFLLRANYDRILDIRRNHERLVIALEEALQAARRADRDLPAHIQAVRQFLHQTVTREVDVLRRFLRRV